MYLALVGRQESSVNGVIGNLTTPFGRSTIARSLISFAVTRAIQSKYERCKLRTFDEILVGC